MLQSPREAQQRGSQICLGHPAGYAIMQVLLTHTCSLSPAVLSMRLSLPAALVKLCSPASRAGEWIQAIQ